MERKGQSTLELSLVVGMLVLLLVGIVRIMGWFGSDMTVRQESYLVSRVPAGSVSPGMANPYLTPQLSVLREEDIAPYSVEELLKLASQSTKDPEEVIKTLEQLKREVAKVGAPYTSTYLASLDDAINTVRENPDYFKSLEGTEGYEPMTSKPPGEGWWNTHHSGGRGWYFNQ